MEWSTTGGIFKICEWIYRLAYLNIIASLFTLLGLGIFGFFPSIIAMYTIIHRWQSGEDITSVFREFCRLYKQHFIKSNGICVLFILVGIFLYIDFALVQNLNGILFYLLLGSSTTVLILSMGVFLHMFFLLSQTEHNLVVQIKGAIHVTARYPFQTGWMFLSVTSFLFISAVIPAVGILFAGSVSTFIVVSFSRHLVRKTEKNYQQHLATKTYPVATTLTNKGGTTYAE